MTEQLAPTKSEAKAQYCGYKSGDGCDDCKARKALRCIDPLAVQGRRVDDTHGTKYGPTKDSLYDTRVVGA